MDLNPSSSATVSHSLRMCIGVLRLHGAPGQVLLDVIGHLLTGVMLHCLFYCTKPLTKTLAMILYTNTQTPYNGLFLDFDQANWHLTSSKSMLLTSTDSMASREYAESLFCVIVVLGSFFTCFRVEKDLSPSQLVTGMVKNLSATKTLGNVILNPLRSTICSSSAAEVLSL